MREGGVERDSGAGGGGDPGRGGSRRAAVAARYAPDAFDILLASQAARERAWTPAMLMHAAVLEDAIALVIDPPEDVAEEDRLQAARWLDEDDEVSRISFRDCCDAIDADPDTIRRSVRDRLARQTRAGFEVVNGGRQ